MTLTARNISAVFATCSFNFSALQPILFHIIVAEGHYMLCSIEDIFFKKKGEQSYAVATVMSKVTCMLQAWCTVHGVDTTDVYVLLVRFALAHLKM